MKSHREWEDFALHRRRGARLAARRCPKLEPGPAVRAFYEAYAARAGKPRWGEKTPRYVLKMPLIQAALPEARFVHVIRDGRDVALSVLDRTVQGRRRRRGRPPLAAQDRARPRGRARAGPLPRGPLRGPGRRPAAGAGADLRVHRAATSTRRCWTTTSAPASAWRRCAASCPRATARRSSRSSGGWRPTAAPPPRPTPAAPRRWRERDERRPTASRFEAVAGETRSATPRLSRCSDAPSVAFLICVEAGQLEQQGVLFARSLRRFGGRFAGCAIHAYAPREGHEPVGGDASPRSRRWGSTVHTEAAEHRARLLPVREQDLRGRGRRAGPGRGRDRLLRLRHGLPSPAGRAGARPRASTSRSRPRSTSTRRSTGPEPPDGALLGAGVGDRRRRASPPYVETVGTQKRIRGYWNAGILAARRSSGYCAEWLELWRRCSRRSTSPTTR